MRAIRIRLLVVVACVATSILAGPAGAQGKPDNVGFIGIPEYTSSETGIPFFYQDTAERVDKAFRDMRAAIAKCDRATYDSARAEVGVYHVPPGAGVGPDHAPQINRDIKSV